MNTTSWISSRTTSLSAQYLSSLNQLPTAAASHARTAGSADPLFADQLRAQASTDINLAKMTPPPAAILSANTPPTPETGASTAGAVNARAASEATPLRSTEPSATPAWDMLKSLTPAVFNLEKRPTAFDFDSQSLSTDQVQDVPESAKQAMQQFVGETFYGMLMKQMRNTIVQSDLFGNSTAKKMFEGQLDQTMVQELATNHSEFLSKPIRI